MKILILTTILIMTAVGTFGQFIEPPIGEACVAEDFPSCPSAVAYIEGNGCVLDYLKDHGTTCSAVGHEFDPKIDSFSIVDEFLKG